MKEYPSIYHMNNSGVGKQRHFTQGQKIALAQPGLWDSALTYNNIVVFADKNQRSLDKQVFEFMKRNRKLTDIEESQRLLRALEEKRYAEIKDPIMGLYTAKVIKEFYMGPDPKSGTRWMIFTEKPENVIYGKKEPGPLSNWFN